MDIDEFDAGRFKSVVSARLDLEIATFRAAIAHLDTAECSARRAHHLARLLELKLGIRSDMADVEAWLEGHGLALEYGALNKWQIGAVKAWRTRRAKQQQEQPQ